jgi:AcrR family transcriptional regulator
METSLPQENQVTTHQQARAQTREMLRRNAVDAASRILMHEGAGAITVRRIAQELECSTKVIYTLFGSKEGLANELYREGFERLRQALGQVPPAVEPATYLTAIGWAYWEFAIANPSYYGVMFGGAIPDFTPNEANLRAMSATLAVVVGAVQQYMEQGRIAGGDPVIVTQSLWTLLHGIVSLRLAGHFAAPGKGPALLRFSLNTLLTGLLRNSAG